MKSETPVKRFYTKSTWINILNSNHINKIATINLLYKDTESQTNNINVPPSISDKRHTLPTLQHPH